MSPRIACWKPIRSLIVVQLLGLVWAASLQADPTVSLVAVKKNGVAITPTSRVTAVANDILECEIQVAGFTNLVAELGGYSIALAGRSGVDSAVMYSDGCGLILSVGWHALLDPITCQTDSDCAEFFPYAICQLQGAVGTCVASDHHPEQGAFVTTSRADFLLSGYTIFGGFDLQTLDYVVAFAAFICGTFEQEGPYYAGTLKLKVQPGASGTFTFGFVEGENFLIVPIPPQPNTVPLRGIPLAIQVNGECPIRIIATDPPPCTIDARLPNDPQNVSQRYGFEKITLTFSRDPGPLTPADFEMSGIPLDPPPGICGIDQVGPVVTVKFCHSIPSGRWTCVKALFGQQDIACIGALGADTDASGLSESADTLALIDALGDNPPALQIWQTDLDRSGMFTPLDILASIDLLNGAAALFAFNGASIPTCPTSGLIIPP